MNVTLNTIRFHGFVSYWTKSEKIKSLLGRRWEGRVGYNLHTPSCSGWHSCVHRLLKSDTFLSSGNPCLWSRSSLLSAGRIRGLNLQAILGSCIPQYPRTVNHTWTRLRAVPLRSVTSKLGRTGESELTERGTGERREQSLFGQSPLSSAGLERANWPRGELERGGSSPSSVSHL